MSLRPMWPLPPGFASRSYCILPRLATSPLHPAAKPPLPLSLQALNLTQPIISHACILFFTQTQYLHSTHLHPVNSGAQHSTAPVNLQSSIHAHTTINTNTLKNRPSYGGFFLLSVILCEEVRTLLFETKWKNRFKRWKRLWKVRFNNISIGLYITPFLENAQTWSSDWKEIQSAMPERSATKS